MAEGVKGELETSDESAKFSSRLISGRTARDDDKMLLYSTEDIDISVNSECLQYRNQGRPTYRGSNLGSYAANRKMR